MQKKTNTRRATKRVVESSIPLTKTTQTKKVSTEKKGAGNDKVVGLPDTEAKVTGLNNNTTKIQRNTKCKKVSKGELISLLRYQKHQILNVEKNKPTLEDCLHTFFGDCGGVISSVDEVLQLIEGISEVGFSVTTTKNGDMYNASIFITKGNKKGEALSPYDCIGHTPNTALLQAIVHSWDYIKKLIV